MPSLTLPMLGNWLIEPRAGRTINAALFDRANGDVGEIPRIWCASSRDTSKMPKAIAVLPLVGIMEPRTSDYSYYFGGTSTEDYGRSFDMAIADPNVKAILLDVFSPGGMVYGTPELASKIFSARGSKPIIALANPMAASAALWVATAADRLYSIPSGDVGSHGVYQMHVDYSKNLEGEGIKVTFIAAGKYKTEGNPYEPATADFLDNAQSEVNEIMHEFTGALARHRGKTSAHATENFGQGRLLGAKTATAAGLIDGTATFDQVVARLMSGHIRTDKTAANDDWVTPVQSEYSEPRFGNASDLKRRLAVARR